jgi:P-aminobenzoate N-oxygenase AurF
MTALAFDLQDTARIDFSRPFIAEQFTPLFHTEEYRSLPDAARLRYNQIHALYFNEQVAFFEREMLSPALLALQRCALPMKLAIGLQTFFEEEQRHTAMFRALNRQCAPNLYADNRYHLIRVPAPLRMVLRAISRRPLTFPLLVWLALLQEERSLFFSKGCLHHAEQLEPHFVAVHRAHLADEVGHVGWDEELLDWLWPQFGVAMRLMNAWLLRWLLGEFFLLPKRSAVRVVKELVREFPNIDLASLRCGLRALKRNREYLRSLYSREITPRSFARFDTHPEFALLAKMLPGYHPTRIAL